MRFQDTRTQREVSLRLAVAQLRKLGQAAPHARLAALHIGERVAHLERLPPPPPTAQAIMALTGASTSAVYRWTTGRAKFPLDVFLRLTLAHDADLPTALSWATTWTGTCFAGDPPPPKPALVLTAQPKRPVAPRVPPAHIA